VVGWSLALACAIVMPGCAEEPAEGWEGGGVTVTCIAGQELACGPCANAAMGIAICTAQNVPGACMCPSAAPGTAAGAGGFAGTASGGAGGVGGGAAGAAGMMVVAGAGGATGGAGGMTGGMGGATGGMGGMTGGMGGATGGAGGVGGTGGVPDNATCESAANWDPAWAQFEEEVLRLTNEARATGYNCDSMGNFGPADPLTMSPILRCSSRLHSQDMGENGYFAHESQDGRSPFKRMEDAGYMGFTMGENIAKGQQSPSDVVDGWLESDGHCSNMMNPDFTEIGVGYWEGEPENMFFNGNKLWTQNFGAPAGAGNCPWCN
jgi:uncharacterized protein YkwD